MDALSTKVYPKTQTEDRDRVFRCRRCGGYRGDLVPASADACRCVVPPGVLLKDVEPEEVFWLWERRIPYGKITVLDGDPGLGKSVLTMEIAARVTVGLALPGGQPVDPAGVVILNAEDGLADTIRPRLDAAGGDPSRVLALATVADKEGRERPLSIPEDIPTIERGLERVHAAVLIIDPLMAFLSADVNSFRDQDVRRALAPLKVMAERTGAAVLVVRKASGSNVLYRGGGSIGIVGAARSGLVVGQHPEDEELRVLAGQKSNLSEPPDSLAYRVVQATNGAARVQWAGRSEHKAAALLAMPADEEDRSALAEAKEFLREVLRDGPVWSKQVKKEARAADITEATLRRAKAALRIVSEKEGDGSWSWALPGVAGEGDDDD